MCLILMRSMHKEYRNVEIEGSRFNVHNSQMLHNDCKHSHHKKHTYANSCTMRQFQTSFCETCRWKLHHMTHTHKPHIHHPKSSLRFAKIVNVAVSLSAYHYIIDAIPKYILANFVYYTNSMWWRSKEKIDSILWQQMQHVVRDKWKWKEAVYRCVSTVYHKHNRTIKQSKCDSIIFFVLVSFASHLNHFSCHFWFCKYII